MTSPMAGAPISRAATAHPVSTSVWISVSFGAKTQSDDALRHPVADRLEPARRGRGRFRTERRTEALIAALMLVDGIDHGGIEFGSTGSSVASPS